MISSNSDAVASNTVDRADAVVDEFEDQLEQTINQAQAEASRRVPVDTGALRDDISIDRGDRWAEIWNTLHYAPHVNFGTDAHTITPNEAEALRFEVDGREVFAAKVEHPGTPATYYMTDAALDAFIDSIDRIEAWD